MKKKTDKVIVYTDGSCEPNPGPGGWAAIILEDGGETILKGYDKNSTNNRMEIMAALEALRHIDPQKVVLIYTDSQYLKNGVELWMKNWKARNWKRKGGKLMNVDLWKQISDAVEQRNITWRWVKGHNSNPYNERADRLARHMMKNRK